MHAGIFRYKYPDLCGGHADKYKERKLVPENTLIPDKLLSIDEHI